MMVDKMSGNIIGKRIQLENNNSRKEVLMTL